MIKRINIKPKNKTHRTTNINNKITILTSLCLSSLFIVSCDVGGQKVLKNKRINLLQKILYLIQKDLLIANLLYIMKQRLRT